MREVSNAWKEAHKQTLLPETFVEITFNTIDTTISSEHIIFRGADQPSFSNPENIINNLSDPPPERCALLEHNMWWLDGSRTVLSDTESYVAPGFVTTNNWLDIYPNMAIKNELPGFIIVWSKEYGDYAVDFEVKRYAEAEYKETVTVTNNNSNVSYIEFPYSSGEVCIRIQKWSLPNRRYRIDGFVFGQVLTFGKNELISYTHEQSGDLIGAELPKNSISFSLNNADGRWNLLNPKSLGKSLYKRQPLRIRYGMDVNGKTEWIEAGTFYLSEWRIPSNGLEAHFVARDGLEFMFSTTYGRISCPGYVTSLQGASYYHTLEDVATGEPVGTLALATKVSISDCGFSWVPSMTGGFSAYRVDKGWVKAADITLSVNLKLLSSCQEAVSQCGYIGDTTMQYGETLGSLDGLRVFKEMSVAEYLQLCANACGYTIWQSGDNVLHMDTPPISLTDYVIASKVSYTHPELELTKQLKQIWMKCHDEFDPDDSRSLWMNCADDGEVVTLDNPFWKYDSHANNLVQWFRRVLDNRSTLSGEYRADPRLELFDVVTVEGEYGDISPVMITNIKYTYNGSFRGTYQGKIIDVSWED